ncbi:MAG: hypothetical protein AB7O97_06295 [Planctomycetota bacterium]
MEDRRRSLRSVALGAWLLAAAAALWGGVRALTSDDDLAPWGSPVVLALTAMAAFAPLALLLAALRLRAHRRAATAPAAGVLLRRALGGTVLLWLAMALGTSTYNTARIGAWFAAWGGVLAALLALAPTPQRARPPGRLARLGVGFALCVPLADLTLRAAAAIAPGPLWTRAAAGSQRRLRAHAFAPGEVHLGTACNGRGFYDEPFAAPGADCGAVVAVIGDSFSASFVPHSMHYTTVAERALAAAGRPAALWNVGWPAIGPAEYRWLLQNEVLPLAPDVVVVSLFLGNDLLETPRAGVGDLWLRDWFDRGNLLCWEVPRRLLLVARGAATPASAAAGADLDAVLRARPWLLDPPREPGTFTPDEFLRVETERAVAFSTIDPARWTAFEHELGRLRTLCADRPLLFALIPDESMVEDALWRRVEIAAGRPLRRHELRQRLLRWCEAAAIPCVDFWPALAAEPALADGDRHLYLLRDTHWNARGNAVAGRVLAERLRALPQLAPR